jgi:hypothetical protein
VAALGHKEQAQLWERRYREEALSREQGQHTVRELEGKLEVLVVKCSHHTCAHVAARHVLLRVQHCFTKFLQLLVVTFFGCVSPPTEFDYV